MMKKNINQKMIPLIEYYKLINLGLIFNKSPIIRFKKEEPTLNINEIEFR